MRTTTRWRLDAAMPPAFQQTTLTLDDPLLPNPNFKVKIAEDVR